MVAGLFSRDLGVHVDTDGDRAVRIALDAVKAVRKAPGATWFRPDFAHDGVMDLADYPSDDHQCGLFAQVE